MDAAAGVARAQQALRAGRSARIVQCARLRPARAEDAAQLRFAVEDALRTADFGDCGRLIVVRRLRLPALPPRAGSALVARALETAWRALVTRAVAASHPAAPAADAVYFGARADARLAWLERAVSGGDATAWHWPAALPELAPVAVGSDAPAAAVCAVVEALLQEAGAAPLVAALRAWPDRTVAALARQLSADLNRRLLQTIAPAAAERPRAAAPAAPAPAREVAAALPAASARTVQRLRDQAPLPASAAIWIAALWMAPSVATAHTNAAQLRDIVARAGVSLGPFADDAVLGMQEPRAADGAAPPSGQPSVADRAEAALPRPTGAEPAAIPAPPAPRRPPPQRLESGLRSEPAAATQPARAAPALPWLVDAQATAHGGLLCLLNVLQALRFEEGLAQQAPPLRLPFVHALLAQALRDAGAAADDPQHAWLALSPTDASLVAAVEAQRALREWRWRLRRVLRRRVGIDLLALVRRDAWVSATATHVDVVFPLDAVDLRLRRHGLDSDPGWVPWFGRIVAFHFVAAALLPPHAHG